MTDNEFLKPLFAELEKLVQSAKPSDEHPERSEVEQRIKQRLNSDLEAFLYDEDLIKVMQHVLSCPMCLEQAVRWHEEQTEQKQKRFLWPWELAERINAFGDLSKRAGIYVPVLYTAAALLLALIGVLVDHWLGASGALVADSGAGGGLPPIRQ